MNSNVAMSSKSLVEEFRDELHRLARWWIHHATDEVRGGYFGLISEQNVADDQAHKSIILNARILWFFAEAASVTGVDEYRVAAERAFNYLVEKFHDPVHGGVFWMLDADGGLVDGRKHTYAQAFTIYGLSAYFGLSRDMSALTLGMELFQLLETHAKDAQHCGYFEALSRSWQSGADGRLSEKEDDSPKTMNTNLHVLEAYTQLYNRVIDLPLFAQPVRAALQLQLDVFCRHIINSETGHLNLFMDENWQDHSPGYSFGHDIECSWLIVKAVESLQLADGSTYLGLAQSLAEVCLRDGVSDEGCVSDEYNRLTQTLSPSAWWVHAEAMVGFTTMWKLGGGEEYWLVTERIWQYIKNQYLDHLNGEWFWFAQQDHHRAAMGYKIGPWKAPYHNGRAMMQMMSLLDTGAIR